VFAIEPPAVEAAVGSVPSPSYRLAASPSPHKTLGSFSPSKVRVCMFFQRCTHQGVYVCVCMCVCVCVCVYIYIHIYSSIV
jgi:hypothetical protein